MCMSIYECEWVCVRMRICIRINVCLYTYVNEYVYVYECEYVWMSIVSVWVWVCMSVSVYVWECVYVFVCVWVCKCVCMCIMSKSVFVGVSVWMGVLEGLVFFLLGLEFLVLFCFVVLMNKLVWLLLTGVFWYCGYMRR